jgi:hypothetical protein
MPLSLTYRGLDLGLAYFVDILVNDIVVLEIKSVSALFTVHTAQLITHLRLMQKPVGLLINFNVPVLTHGIKRVFAVNCGLAAPDFVRRPAQGESPTRKQHENERLLAGAALFLCPRAKRGPPALRASP